MSVPGVTGSYNSALIQSNSRAQADAPSGELTTDDFYALLAAQLKYQDADNPMDTSEMMSQMVQTDMIETLGEMSQAISLLTSINVTNYASSMVGQEVTVAKLNDEGVYEGENLKGMVTGVMFGEQPIIFVDGEPYDLSQIMSVGTVPEEALEDATNPDSTTDDTTTEPTEQESVG